MKITAVKTVVVNAEMRNWVFVKVETDVPDSWLALIGCGQASLPPTALRAAEQRLISAKRLATSRSSRAGLTRLAPGPHDPHGLGHLVDVHHHCPLEVGDGAGYCVQTLERLTSPGSGGSSASVPSWWSILSAARGVRSGILGRPGPDRYHGTVPVFSEPDPVAAERGAWGYCCGRPVGGEALSAGPSNPKHASILHRAMFTGVRRVIPGSVINRPGVGRCSAVSVSGTSVWRTS